MTYTRLVNNKVTEAYSVVNITLDRVNRQVYVKLAQIAFNKQNVPTVEFKDFSITNLNEYIIDPEWNEDSPIPKPRNFDYMDPSTWGTLSWDQIPRVLDKTKLYADRILSSTNASVEKVIIEVLIETGKLPCGEEWSIVE